MKKLNMSIQEKKTKKKKQDGKLKHQTKLKKCFKAILFNRKTSMKICLHIIQNSTTNFEGKNLSCLKKK